MDIFSLRKLANREIIDHLWLTDALKNCDKPQEMLSLWLKTNDLIHIRNGIYLFGPPSRQTFYNPLIIANLIYGPSAVSLTYALSFYGLIPERVYQITSVSSQDEAYFETTIGRYSYHYLQPKQYSPGIEWIQENKYESYLIASPEKALCDHLLITDKNITLNTLHDIEVYLEYDMRIDMSALNNFNTVLLQEIAHHYNDKRLFLLYTFVKCWKKK